MGSVTVLAYVLAGLVAIVWLFLKKKYSYWKDRGVPYVEPKIPFGNLKGVGKTIHFKDFLCNIYNQYKGTGSFIGTYFFAEPVAIVLDSELVKNVLIQDFSYFQDRNLYYNEKNDPLTTNLFNLDGEKWKIVRQKLSPTFTSGKMKQMFPLVTKVADQLLEILDSMVDKSSVIEIQDMLTRFTTDNVGTVIFGIECNSLKDPNTEFRLKGRRVLYEPRHGDLVRILIETFPKVARFFKIKVYRDEVIEFFLRIVRETIDYREKNNVQRNDFMDLLIQLKNIGSVDGHIDENGKLSFEQVVAQAFVFFVGGYETSAITIGYTLYALALHQDIQEKVRQEIFDVLEKHDGKFTYEAMMSMKYLHQVVNETFRVYPPVAQLFRKVRKNYQVPNTKYVLEKGTMVVVPVTAIHYDHEIYPNPQEFNPDNFSTEAMEHRHSINFLPFGDGPRNCLGLRFALNQIYVALIGLLRNYRIKPSPKTPNSIKYKLNVRVLIPDSEFYLQMEKL